MHKENDDFAENLHEVNEKVQGMGNEILVSTSAPFDDHLCVPHDESTEQQETSPQVHL